VFITAGAVVRSALADTNTAAAAAAAAGCVSESDDVCVTIDKRSMSTTLPLSSI